MTDEPTEAEQPPASELEEERSATYKAIEANLIPAAESVEIAEEQETELDFEADNAHLSFHNRLEKKRRRERWDTVLLILVVFGFGASYWMILLIGTGILKFENSAFAVPSVVAAGIVETYGLSKLAIKYFFNDDDDTKGEKK